MNAPEERVWVILYDDAEALPEVFTREGAEEAAKARYAQASNGYQCVLLTNAAHSTDLARQLAEQKASALRFQQRMEDVEDGLRREVDRLREGLDAALEAAQAVGRMKESAEREVEELRRERDEARGAEYVLILGAQAAEKARMRAEAQLATARAWIEKFTDYMRSFADDAVRPDEWIMCEWVRKGEDALAALTSAPEPPLSKCVGTKDGMHRFRCTYCNAEAAPEAPKEDA